MDDYFRYMYNGKEADERMMYSRYEEGMEAGIEAGAKEEKIEIAKNLINLGNNSLDEISKVTGLTVEEIESLRTNK